MELRHKNLILILLMASILMVFSKMFLTGTTIVSQTIEQLSKFGVSPSYAFSVAALSIVRELAPINVGLIFCTFSPFIMLLCQDEQGRILFKKFFLVLLFTLPIYNIFAVFVGLLSAYKSAIMVNYTTDILVAVGDIITLEDIVTSLVKSFCFACVLGALGYFLSKPFFRKKKASYKAAFVIVFMPIGIVLVILADMFLTMLFYFSW